jgi:hypothetical protein
MRCSIWGLVLHIDLHCSPQGLAGAWVWRSPFNMAFIASSNVRIVCAGTQQRLYTNFWSCMYQHILRFAALTVQKS